jgi:type II secretion system protein G
MKSFAPVKSDEWQVTSRRVSSSLTALPAPRSLPSARHSPLVTCHCGRREGAAFTLIELLVVIAIIAILAGLTLSTLGYVNRKGAESRAKAEVAALSAAIDNYKLDFGSYPPVSNTNSPVELYRELTGSSTATVNKTKVYFEPTPNITTNIATGPFIDPWGTAYIYSTNTNIANVGFFDLVSKAGGKTNPSDWIRN